MPRSIAAFHGPGILEIHQRKQFIVPANKSRHRSLLLLEKHMLNDVEPRVPLESRLSLDIIYPLNLTRDNWTFPLIPKPLLTLRHKEN